jgi:hypothetical protein
MGRSVTVTIDCPTATGAAPSMPIVVTERRQCPISGVGNNGNGNNKYLSKTGLSKTDFNKTSLNKTSLNKKVIFNEIASANGLADIITAPKKSKLSGIRLIPTNMTIAITAR